MLNPVIKLNNNSLITVIILQSVESTGSMVYRYVTVSNLLPPLLTTNRYTAIMSLDGGGWTLVWNSFMDNLPLYDNMRYYSGYYKACTSISDRGWCNIPKKAGMFSPKEQMIVAYHNTHVVYAYKGLFNRNIDHDWSGGILLDFKKIVDKCIQHNGISSQLLQLIIFLE